MFEFIVENANLGIFAVDREMKVRQWNRFMAAHSGVTPEQVLGKCLFECFAELPRRWLEKKLRSVFLLNNFAFTSWEQRPYLFRFRHDRPVTGGVDWMQQNCTFIPVRDKAGGVDLVCVTLQDATEICIAQRRLEQAMAAVQECADRDALTGIYNRRYFQSRIDAEFARFVRHGGKLSLALFDLDLFKRVNDTHGHPAGDEVLREVSRRAASVLRKTDVFCRYGGEEFGVILPETGIEGACIVAKKLIEAIRAEPVSTPQAAIAVTISAGIAQAGPHTANYGVLMSQADDALYTAKRNGRCRHERYRPPSADTPAQTACVAAPQ